MLGIQAWVVQRIKALDIRFTASDELAFRKNLEDRLILSRLILSSFFVIAHSAYEGHVLLAEIISDSPFEWGVSDFRTAYFNTVILGVVGYLSWLNVLIMRASCRTFKSWNWESMVAAATALEALFYFSCTRVHLASICGHNANSIWHGSDPLQDETARDLLAPFALVAHSVWLPLRVCVLWIPFIAVCITRMFVMLHLGKSSEAIGTWKLLTTLCTAIFLFAGTWMRELNMRQKWRANQEVMHEKALRCQAEFAIEQLTLGAYCQCGSRPSFKQHGIHTSGQSKAPKKQLPLLQSSHATFMQVETTHTDEDVTPACTEADCLPLDAIVWVQDRAMPSRISDVQEGMRVLCYDHLARTIKYVPISEIHTKQGTVGWTQVTLKGGITLDMTSEHPVQPCSVNDVQPCVSVRHVPPIKAADLTPNSDSLLVLKVEPTPVEDIRSSIKDGSQVYITLEQPERHSIFVAGSHSNNEVFSAMAVESCDLLVRSTPRFVEKSTFLDLAPIHRNGRKRSNSAVPKLETQPFALKEVDSEDSEDGFATSDEVIVNLPPLRQEYSGWRAAQQQQGQNLPASLQAVQRLRAAGLHSVGSVYHSAGNCKPCAHQHKHYQKGTLPCFKGSLCDRCHQKHDKQQTWRKRW